MALNRNSHLQPDTINLMNRLFLAVFFVIVVCPFACENRLDGNMVATSVFVNDCIFIRSFEHRIVFANSNSRPFQGAARRIQDRRVVIPIDLAVAMLNAFNVAHSSGLNDLD